MKSRFVIISFICLMLAGCSSTKMSLKSYHQDMPTALVEKYNASTEDYVDEGESYVLPLYTQNDYVAKTVSGFSADSHAYLGIVLGHSQINSYFDEEGRLQKYSLYESILAPIVYRYAFLMDKTGEKIRVGRSRSVLSFGYKEKISGQKYLLALWIPIPINKVESLNESTPERAVSE